MIKKTKICAIVLLAGLFGAVFSYSTAGTYLEEEIGLSWLFHLRGELPAPADVIIVTLDQTSTEILHLPDNPDDWSRSFYVTLLEKLNQQAPALIAFNIHFGNSRERDQDIQLANAIKQDKNVLLTNYLKSYTMPSPTGGEEIYSERIIEPIQELSQAALGAAPFLIPKTSSTVKQFWTYKHSAGDLATFPVCIFQFFVLKQAYPEAMQIFTQVDRDAFAEFPATFNDVVENNKVSLLMSSINKLLTNDPRKLDKLTTLLAESKYSSQVNRLLNSWLKLFKENERLYLNYYGDVGTITTVPFYQVITPNGVSANLFRNKIVLVGYGDNLEPEKQQGFYSVFSKRSGKVISPIEIAGTAVANVLGQSWLRPIPVIERFFLVLFWGIFLSVLFRYFSFHIALILALTAVCYYLISSWYLFSIHYIWMPLFIPLLQASFIILGEAMLRYRRIKKISGYYLPKEVLAINTLYPEDMKHFSMSREGVCMATDAGQYTTLAEMINPLELHKLMNNYYAAIFPVVKKHGGVISDVIGDAMLAIWSTTMADETLKVNVCRAALEIKSALDTFNKTSPHSLDTRIALHFGEMQVGNVGSMEHYEFRAVGDTVNTVSRIEGLNKVLGTRLLVSKAVIEQISIFVNRDVGTFLLRGKANPITVFELLGDKTIVSRDQPQLADLFIIFEEALNLFRNKHWQEALNSFLAINQNFPGDGPTRFYIAYLQEYMQTLQNLTDYHPAIIDMDNVKSVLQNLTLRA